MIESTTNRAVEMLTAYAELIKATGKYAEMHYVPEIEFVVSELRSACEGAGSIPSEGRPLLEAVVGLRVLYDNHHVTPEHFRLTIEAVSDAARAALAASDESLSRQSSEAAESPRSTRNTAYESAVAQLKQDSARYQWLKERLYGADFQYGDPAMSVVVFFWPDTPISANLDASIDDAMATTEPSPTGEQK